MYFAFSYGIVILCVCVLQLMLQFTFFHLSISFVPFGKVRKTTAWGSDQIDLDVNELLSDGVCSVSLSPSVSLAHTHTHTYNLPIVIDTAALLMQCHLPLCQS